jgi:NIMA (never in mitosis gene a)-related kinase
MEYAEKGDLYKVIIQLITLLQLLKD